MIPTTFCNIIMDLAVCSISSSELLGKITKSHCYEFYLRLHIFWDNFKIQLRDRSFLQFSTSFHLQHSKKTTYLLDGIHKGPNYIIAHALEVLLPHLASYCWSLNTLINLCINLLKHLYEIGSCLVLLIKIWPYVSLLKQSEHDGLDIQVQLNVEHPHEADIIPNMTRSPRVKYITYYEDSENLPEKRTAVWELDKGIKISTELFWTIWNFMVNYWLC